MLSIALDKSNKIWLKLDLTCVIYLLFFQENEKLKKITEAVNFQINIATIVIAIKDNSFMCVIKLLHLCPNFYFSFCYCQ